jgi:hypothetical protein
VAAINRMEYLVTWNLSISRAELEAAWLGAAQPIADTPGLRWKVWLMNEAKREAGGIYLFESEGAAQAYLGGGVGPTKAKDSNREEKSIVSRTVGGTMRSKCLQQILATG